MKKSEIKAIEEGKREWICKHCGQSTFDVDYDYLCAQDEHLECALIYEGKSERKNCQIIYEQVQENTIGADPNFY